MGDVIRLESSSPLSWTVEEALERALEKVKSGEFQVDSVYVAMCKNPSEEEPDRKIFYTMAGMRLPEALGWLYMHLNNLSEWN